MPISEFVWRNRCFSVVSTVLKPQIYAISQRILNFKPCSSAREHEKKDI